MKIIGIDPGSRVTGYGVILITGNKQSYIDSGCIKVDSEDMAQRLLQIYQGINQVMQLHRPDRAAIERVFVHKNVSSALKLGQARGAALLALAQQQLPIHEYTPREVKQSIVGYGAAEKNQVQKMIQVLLNLTTQPKTDAADALAIALCGAQSSQRAWV